MEFTLAFGPKPEFSFSFKFLHMIESMLKEKVDLQEHLIYM